MRLIPFIILLFLSVKCAQISPITGGDKDIYAPAIDTIKSYPKNGAINFKGSEISLKFNEFIKLNKASENIIITPQLIEKPTFLVKNKRFTLVFNEKLKNNTTYVVNFNGAIQDIRERNDSIFQYVFSTGNYIDSLSVSGVVVDSYTNTPIANCFIAIYPQQDSVQFDSIPYQLKPTYIGQTDKKGVYKIDYLKNGAYSIFAFTDQNKNMLFDLDNEKIGFISDQIIQLDSSLVNVDFRIFDGDAEKVFFTKSEYSYPGKLEIVLNKEPESFTLRSNVEIIKADTESKDSLVYWLAQKPVVNTEFYYTINGGQEDTLVPYLKHQPKDDDLEKLILKSNITRNTLLPDDNLMITVNEPILNIDDTKLHFLDVDSNEVKVDYHFDDVNKLVFYTHNTAKSLKIDSLAIESVFGVFNQKESNYKIENLIGDEYFGQLYVKFDSLDVNYIFELLDSKGKVEKFYNAAPNETKITFNKLKPGKYQLRIIKDLNNDTKWTKGAIKTNQQSETVFYYTDEIKIRSKWDLEIEVEVK
jgi:uncharacterized protein (DUF2141 family)